VGTLTRLSSGMYLLCPNNKSLPQFACPVGTKDIFKVKDDNTSIKSTLYRTEYTHGMWHEMQKWPPFTNVARLCGSCNVQDKMKALLGENNVNHGKFSLIVLHDMEESVKLGQYFNEEEMGWKPTKEMCRGQQDYWNHCVFTIDPATAMDLDGPLHITLFPNRRVESGIHIADVSHFILQIIAVNAEAIVRATTVYLVNGIISMLPHPLCEIACSPSENVERLAFSCAWKMNMDGTLKGSGNGGKSKSGDVWYGQTVIKSCARLDYATAQNIINNKVANR
jgi:DIS3-like exonuclease 2